MLSLPRDKVALSARRSSFLNVESLATAIVYSVTVAIRTVLLPIRCMLYVHYLT